MKFHNIIRSNSIDFSSLLRNTFNQLLGVAISFCVFAAAASAQTANDDPIIGVWKLNIERSVYSPGPRPPSELIRIYQFAPIEDGFIRFTLVQNTNQQGIPNFQMTAFKVDEQQRPVYNQNSLGALLATGQQTNLTRSYRRIDARTTEYITYNNGNPGIPAVRTVSPDGQTYIDVVRGVNANGVAVNNVQVYDRVR